MTSSRPRAGAVLAVALVTLAAACVKPSAGDPEAFCAELRRTAPALLTADDPPPPGPEIKGPASGLREHVPEALVDDVAVLATSDDPDELEEALANVQGYAQSACAEV